MQVLPSGGAMASVSAGREVVAEVLAGTESGGAVSAVSAAREAVAEVPAGTEPGGAVAAASASGDTVAHVPAGTGEGSTSPGFPGVDIAAVNSPRHTTISGPAEAVTAAAAFLSANGVRTSVLPVSHAFHSGLMDPALPALAQAATSVSWQAPAIPVVSTFTGLTLAAEELADPGHWTRHAREAVDFPAALATLTGDHRATVLLEIGPDRTLTTLAGHTLDDDPDTTAVPIPTLHPEHDETETLTTALARLHVTGTAVDWLPALPAADGDTPEGVALPTYAFQRTRYWLSAPATSHTAGLESTGHPLLPSVTGLATGGGLLLTGTLAPHTTPWLTHHAVGGQPLLPGTALLELALHAAGRTDTPHVRELTLHAPSPSPRTDPPPSRSTSARSTRTPGRAGSTSSRARRPTARGPDTPRAPWPRGLLPSSPTPPGGGRRLAPRPSKSATPTRSWRTGVSTTAPPSRG